MDTIFTLEHLDLDLQNNILNQLRILWTYTSNAIEGNTLSLGDTKFIIEEGLTISGKTLKEHNEVMGHVRAIDIFYSIIEREKITQEDLFLLHTAIQTEMIVDIYRPIYGWKKEINGTNIVINGKLSYKEYPKPEAIPPIMKIWFDNFGDFKEGMSWDELIVEYAKMHITFVSIHPFFDGNGRIARLISNYPLLRGGYPPIMVSKERRKRYLELVSQYQIHSDALTVDSQKILVENNPYFIEFLVFCKEEYRQTQEIIEEAKVLQEKRKKLN